MMENKENEPCVGCGKKGDYRVHSINRWACEKCNPSVQNYVAAVLSKSPYFRKYTWEGFFNKFNYGENKKSKL